MVRKSGYQIAGKERLARTVQTLHVQRAKQIQNQSQFPVFHSTDGLVRIFSKTPPASANVPFTAGQRHILSTLLSVLLVLVVLIPGVTGCKRSEHLEVNQDADNHFVVYLAHVNDTHAQIDPVERSFSMNDQTVSMPVGGYPRVHAQIAGWRNLAAGEQAGFLFLHAGDTFEGSAYFKLFQGEPEAVMWNRIGLDAMVLGNHEFDSLRAMEIQRDAQGQVVSVALGEAFPAEVKLAEFIRSANFPLLAANMRVPDSSPLFGLPNFAPWVIKEVDGHSIGIFGILPEDMPAISYPGKELVFLPEMETAREMVKLLLEQGVSRIIMLSHIGYARDIRIARAVDGIDVIVGGHTHSVLGDFSAAGLASEGPYPTVVASPSGSKTVIVQAGSHAAMAGLLRVVFDEEGQVVRADGANHFLALADHGPYPPGEFQAGRGGVIAWEHENLRDRQFIDQTYGAVVQKAYGPIIAKIVVPLKHERIPTDPAGHGSTLAPLVAEGLADELALQGFAVDFALVNAGAVRTSLPAGEFRENQPMLEVMPFSNRTVLFELTGAQIRMVLETVITTALANPDEDGRFPYPARLRYVYDAALPEGERLSQVAVLEETGGWKPLEAERSYRIATNYYIASGRDGYDLMKRFIDANTSLQVLGALDNQLFRDYVQRTAELHAGVLSPLDYSPVTLKNH